MQPVIWVGEPSIPHDRFRVSRHCPGAGIAGERGRSDAYACVLTSAVQRAALGDVHHQPVAHGDAYDQSIPDGDTERIALALGVSDPGALAVFDPGAVAIRHD